MSVNSSRSHSIFIIKLEQIDTVNGEKSILSGQLKMVDLAGSDKLSMNGVSGQRLKETIAINQSISNLNLVVKKLVDKVSHVPYRDSTLTRMLQDSLKGNSKTMMVANINPASDNYRLYALLRKLIKQRINQEQI
ncbi:Kinesin-like_protein [Hexamita inflata]|uniref:Kinesin-like protein n=1 Tax=Hexamita inflata TaxID=28002 RepID=A0AA86UHT2_9EUKA|nr:Kinesin-like protein [Hexamita inflata]